MKTSCAWCGASMTGEETDPPASDAGELISHGICPDCAEVMLRELGVPVTEFLSELGIPVMLVTDDIRVLDANPAALSMVGGEPSTILGKLGGQVFECSNSRLPGGCGRTIHCSGCVLRQTVISTWTTGETHRRVPATLEVLPEGSTTRIDLFVSTAKVGDRVVLRIDA